VRSLGSDLILLMNRHPAKEVRKSWEPERERPGSIDRKCYESIDARTSVVTVSLNYVEEGC